MLITSPEYGSLILQPVDTGNMQGPLLPGCTCYKCEQDFGSIFLQKFDAKGYSLRYFILNLVKQVTLVFADSPTAMRVKLFLENALAINVGSGTGQIIKQGQFIVYSGAEDFTVTGLAHHTDFRIFEASYPSESLRDLLDAFPSLSTFLEELPRSQQPGIHPYFDTPAIRQVVTDLLKSPYDEALRKVYFENKVNDFLFEVLAQSAAQSAGEIKLSSGELLAIGKAREIIESDLTKHLSIAEISRLVQLNEYKLKKGFKQVFGIGLFEYLLRSRMNEAHQLIAETTKPLKEIAAIIGYDHISNFGTAFVKHFGYTPATLRNKK